MTYEVVLLVAYHGGPEAYMFTRLFVGSQVDVPSIVREDSRYCGVP